MATAAGKASAVATGEKFSRAASDLGIPDMEGVAQIADALRTARLAAADGTWPGAVFLIGAGCSVSAGVPLARDIAKMCCIDLAKALDRSKIGSVLAEQNSACSQADNDQAALEALRFLRDKGVLPKSVELGNAYGFLFQEALRNPMAQQIFIEKALECRKGRINWAHLCLGELVRQGYVHTVLTTNFDQLALEGMARAGVVPVVADGMGALARIASRPRLPQLVFLHGSLYSYALLNSNQEVRNTPHSIQAGILYQLLVHAHALVVVGYAGGEEGVVQIVKQAAAFHHANNKQFDIFWTQHVRNSEEEPFLPDQVRQVLKYSRMRKPICINDADSFFACLMGRLGISQPAFMNDPFEDLTDTVKLISCDNGYVEAFVTAFSDKLKAVRACWKAENDKDKKVKKRSSANEYVLAARLNVASQLLDEALKEVRDGLDHFARAEQNAEESAQLRYEMADIAAGIIRTAEQAEDSRRESYRQRVERVASELQKVEVELENGEAGKDELFRAFVLRLRARALLWQARGRGDELKNVRLAIELIEKALQTVKQVREIPRLKKELAQTAESDHKRTKRLLEDARAREAYVVGEFDFNQGAQSFRKFVSEIVENDSEGQVILRLFPHGFDGTKWGEENCQLIREVIDAVDGLPGQDQSNLVRVMRILIKAVRGCMAGDGQEPVPRGAHPDEHRSGNRPSDESSHDSGDARLEGNDFTAQKAGSGGAEDATHRQHH